MWLDANKNELRKTGRGLDLAPGIEFADVGRKSQVNLAKLPKREQSPGDAA